MLVLHVSSKSPEKVMGTYFANNMSTFSSPYSSQSLSLTGAYMENLFSYEICLMQNNQLNKLIICKNYWMKINDVPKSHHMYW